MNTRTATGMSPARGTAKRPIVDEQHASDFVPRLPPRSRHDPTAIGVLLHPIRQIIHHPNRNRLLAELFKEQ